MSVEENVVPLRAELTKYDAMCSAISACERLDEIKAIKDTAAQLQAAARIAANLEAEQKCIAIRKRAERRMGELLKGMARAPAGRPTADNTGNTCRNSEYANAIADADIKDRDARRYQKLAEVPEADFEAALAKPKPPKAPRARVVKPKRADEPKVQKSLDPEVPRPAEMRAREIVRGLMDAGVTLPGSHDLEKQYADDPVHPSHNAFDLARAVERALDVERAEQQAGPPIDPETLSLSAQKKLEITQRRLDKHAQRTLAAWRAQLDQQVHERVMAETAERLTMLNEREEEARHERDLYRELTNKHEPLFSVEQWELLRKVCHPDNSASEDVRSIAFRLINSKKFQLTKKK